MSKSSLSDTILKNHLKVVGIVQRRLNLEEKDAGSLSPRGKIIYINMLCNSFLKLICEVHSEEVNNFYPKIVELSWKSVDYAKAELDSCDPLRLLSGLTLCKVLIRLRGNFLQARTVAEDHYNKGCLHSHTLCTESLDILQQLRDDYLTLSKEEAVDYNWTTDTTAVENIDEREPCVSEEVSLSDPPRVRSPMRNTSAQLTEGDTLRSSSGNVDIDAYLANSVPLSIAVRNIKAALTVCARCPSPIPLEPLSGSELFVAALSQIFRGYIRGNALPGLINGAQDVTLGDKKLAMENFLLQGPYISWRGFISVLQDFKIAQAPSRRSKLGGSFYEVWDPHFQYYNATQGCVSSCVTMRDAAILFVESGLTNNPVVMLAQFANQYKKKMELTTVTNRLSGAAAASPLVGSDCWVDVSCWDAKGNWNIQTGLNFMQFVDCLSKVALLAYSSPHFNQVLPTAVLKIEHFFGAGLGLTNRKHAKWKVIVDAKLKISKEKLTSLNKRSKKTVKAK